MADGHGATDIGMVPAAIGMKARMVAMDMETRTATDMEARTATDPGGTGKDSS